MFEALEKDRRLLKEGFKRKRLDQIGKRVVFWYK